MEFSLGLPRAKRIVRGPRDITGRRIIKKERNVKKYLWTFHTTKHPKWNKGPFWSFPLATTCSDSVKYKFSLVSHNFNYASLKSEILYTIANLQFKFPNLLEGESYKAAPAIKSQILAYYAKQEQEWNKVRGLYLRLFKFKKLLRPLIFRWRIAQTLLHVKNTEDPVTLEVPKKLVRIIDLKQGISFVYEANTIRRAIENKILFSDYMFSEPQEPVNLLTNSRLTYGQLISVILQCKAHGEYSWILEQLQASNGSLANFSLYNKSRLNIEAIRAFFKKSKHVIRETVIDYFRVEADFVDLDGYKAANFVIAYNKIPENIMVRKWINHTRDYYIAKELNNPALLIKISVETEILLNMINRVF